ncbi:MAG: hypothetical protein M3525_13380, partial [Acidobacteriota bacterium]|nr:hypothetical protein [Acidobacteriota bacterium]
NFLLINLRCVECYLELITLQVHFYFFHSFKPVQGLFDLLRSSHSYRAAFAFRKTFDVQKNRFQFFTAVLIFRCPQLAATGEKQ